MAILALPVAAHAGIGACGQTFGLLGFWGADGAQDWAAQGVVAVAKWHDPVDAVVPTLPGLTWPISPGSWTELPDLTARHAVFNGQSPNLPAAAWAVEPGPGHSPRPRQGATSHPASRQGFIRMAQCSKETASM